MKPYPNIKFYVLVSDSFHIKTNGWYCSHRLSKFEFVQNCCNIIVLHKTPEDDNTKHIT